MFSYLEESDFEQSYYTTKEMIISYWLLAS
jgi:hypothetical protein